MTQDDNFLWVVPANIPFSELKASDLEECVYWLLDAMGAKQLAWRKGGSGHGAADGGRDLEAHFFEPDDAGSLVDRSWWIECKGRSGTVEKSEVANTVVNAQASPDVYRLVIVTNTQFSNPTRDWVAQWQLAHPMPKVQLWDRADLERYLCRHPDVVARLFSGALSVEGRFRAMESQLWNRLQFVSSGILESLWAKRTNATLSSSTLFAATANEFANGNISVRPWVAELDAATRVEVMGQGFANVFALFHRAIESGTDQRALIGTFGYLVLAVLEVLPAPVTAAFIRSAMSRGKEIAIPDDISGLFLTPILNQLLAELKDICCDDCTRVSMLNRGAFDDDGHELRSYWLRFDPRERLPSDGKRLLIIEQHDASCAVGYSVDCDHPCPLFNLEVADDTLDECLSVIERVAAFRREQAAKKGA